MVMEAPWKGWKGSFAKCVVDTGQEEAPLLNMIVQLPWASPLPTSGSFMGTQVTPGSVASLLCMSPWTRHFLFCISSQENWPYDTRIQFSHYLTYCESMEGFF